MFTKRQEEKLCYASQNQGDYIHIIIYIMKKTRKKEDIRCLKLARWLHLMDSSNEEKNNMKWHANREERHVCVYVYVYVYYLQMEHREKENNNRKKNVINNRQTITKFLSERK